MPVYRPVTVVEYRGAEDWSWVEVPVEDMARLSTALDQADEERETSGIEARVDLAVDLSAGAGDRCAHRSTLIFVNARRVAERMAGALNDLAGEPIARAHHGSAAAAQRSEIEELLKAGRFARWWRRRRWSWGLICGAIDQVIQIESPPSVASGMQRIDGQDTKWERLRAE